MQHIELTCAFHLLACRFGRTAPAYCPCTAGTPYAQTCWGWGSWWRWSPTTWWRWSPLTMALVVGPPLPPLPPSPPTSPLAPPPPTTISVVTVAGREGHPAEVGCSWLLAVELRVLRGLLLLSTVILLSLPFPLPVEISNYLTKSSLATTLEASRMCKSVSPLVQISSFLSSPLILVFTARLATGRLNLN